MLSNENDNHWLFITIALRLAKTLYGVLSMEFWPGLSATGLLAMSAVYK